MALHNVVLNSDTMMGAVLVSLAVQFLKAQGVGFGLIAAHCGGLALMRAV